MFWFIPMTGTRGSNANVKTGANCEIDHYNSKFGKSCEKKKCLHKPWKTSFIQILFLIYARTLNFKNLKYFVVVEKQLLKKLFGLLKLIFYLKLTYVIDIDSKLGTFEKNCLEFVLYE